MAGILAAGQNGGKFNAEDGDFRPDPLGLSKRERVIK